jgi:hypothetical protein
MASSVTTDTAAASAVPDHERLSLGSGRLLQHRELRGPSLMAGLKRMFSCGHRLYPSSHPTMANCEVRCIYADDLEAFMYRKQKSILPREFEPLSRLRASRSGLGIGSRKVCIYHGHMGAEGSPRVRVIEGEY